MSPPPQATGSRKDLAAALLGERAVRADALERAFREQERGGRPLWALLVEAGACTEEAIFQALRRYCGAPVLSEERCAGVRVAPELRAAVPLEVAGELGVLPLDRSPDGRRLALAMVDPLADAPRVRAALARLGVVQVHRYLVHGAVLRRCLAAAYEVPLSDQPTGMVTLPEHARQRSRAVTQPMAPVPSAGHGAGPAAVYGSSTVQVDPQLVAEIERMAEDATPPAPAPSIPEEKTLITHRPTQPTDPPASGRTPAWTGPGMARPARDGGDGTRAEFVLPRSRPERRTPALPVALQIVEREPPDLAPLLQRAVSALVRELEERLFHPIVRAGDLAQLAERAAQGLGLPEAQAIGLLALLYGAERQLVGQAGAAPAELESELGFTRNVLSGLGPSLHELQVALYGPPGGTEGTRRRRARELVRAAQEALELRLHGLDPQEVEGRLSARYPVIGAAVARALDAVPSPAPAPPPSARSPEIDTDRTREHVLPAANLLSSHSLAESSEPDSDPEIEIEAAEISDAGLEAYHVDTES